MRTKMHGIVVAITLAIFSPISDGERVTDLQKGAEKRELTGEELKNASVILAKSFCVALRRKDHATLRGMIDPEYLQHHALNGDGKLPIEMAPVSGIYNIIVAEDRGTVLCLYNTDGGAKEAMLLRTTRRDGHTFVSPPTPPDPTTKMFTPWSLRADLSEFVEKN